MGQITPISSDHFSGGAKVTPTPEVAVRDLADLIIELQAKANELNDGLEATNALLRISRIEITDAESPYTVEDDVNLVAVDTTVAVVSVVLPAPATFEGESITIKDEGGNAAVRAITVTGTVDGAANPTIATAYGKMTVYSNGTAWMTK